MSILEPPPWHRGTKRGRIAEYYWTDESRVVGELLDIPRFPHDVLKRITARARNLVVAVRERRVGTGGIDALRGEVFGSILHVVRYRSDRFDAVIDSINATGFGLTLGIHSRIDETIQYNCPRANVGSMFVNRDQIGAVFGVQPFGGEGLSGTGPKAGGPHYMHRFATECTLSINTTAQGGNTELMSLQDDLNPHLNWRAVGNTDRASRRLNCD